MTFKTVQHLTKRSTGNKLKPVASLASRKQAEAPPTETTRLLAKILDGKDRRSKKRAKQNARAAARKEAPVPNNGAAKSSTMFSTADSGTNRRPSTAAAFGAKKGLSQLPALHNSMLKRKRSTVPDAKDKGPQPKKRVANNMGHAISKRSSTSTSKFGKENSTTKTIDAKEKSTASNTGSKRPTLLFSNPYTKTVKKTPSLAKQSDPSKKQSTSAATNTQKAQLDAKKVSLPTPIENKTLCRQSEPERQREYGGNEQEQPMNEVQPKNIPPDTMDDNADDNRKNKTADGESTIKLQLSLPMANRSQAQRRKRDRSLLRGEEQKHPLNNTPKDASELEILGAMLSATSSATTNSVATLPLSMPQKGPSQSSVSTSLAMGAATYDPRRDNGVCNTKPTRLLPPMQPLRASVAEEGKTKDGSTQAQTSALGNDKNNTLHKPTRKAYNNDNFVRQNLRNSSGACRGARNKKTKSRYYDRYKKGNYYYQKANYEKSDNNDEFSQDRRAPQKEIQKAETFRAGVDPLDDYLDGVLQTDTSQSKAASSDGSKTQAPKTITNQQAEAPKCTRHQRPCKLLVVKKAGTGNKGRKFYCCAMPRGEQCDHFQWADDTVEAAKIALLKNSSHSGFMARQVAAYTERFKKLTVPELREAAKRRNLESTGKKQQLLFRLSVWVRDELASVSPSEAESDKCTGDATKADEATDSAPFPASDTLDVSGLQVTSDEENDKSDSDCSSSDDELEFFGSTPKKSEDTVIPAPIIEEVDRKHPKQNDEECDAAFSGTESVQSGTSEDDTEATPACSIQRALWSLFRYKKVKKGQEWAINRCLKKQKSLLVAPTGFGKSMCYVLPAHLMDGICIVVSPLISLIQDQLRELPPRVPAATLSGSLTTAATAAIVDDIIRKRIKVLFVSPERLASPSFQRLFQPKWNKETNTRERPFPPVSLLCVDEAHCLSQWGHNFRPSYLRLRSLMHKIAPESILAITATAGHQVVQDICRTLDIDQCNTLPDVNNPSNVGTDENSSGVWTMKTDRENIDVKSFIVESQERRLSMLVKLLKSSKPKDSKLESKSGDLELANGSLAKGSVIVYVWRQRDAEVVAESIQAAGVAGGVVHYHGGMDSGTRSNAYSKFMRGKARICVATVAFGLGVNKPDIVGIIHMYLPASPENHLQEIGRAGRDGRAAKALALIVEEEALVRHSQSHSDLVSQSQMRSLLFSFRKLVRQTISSIECETWSQVSAIGVAIPLQEFSAGIDCKAETIETIFSLLELREDCHTPSVQVEGKTLDQVTISLKRRRIEALVGHEAVARVIQSCAVCVDAPAGDKKEDRHSQDDGGFERENSRRQQFASYSFGSYRFSVTQCANMLGPAAQPRHVFAALRRLQSNGEIELTFDKTAAGSALRLVLNNSGIRIFQGNEDDDGQHLESLASSLAEQMNSIATASANKVLDINYIMHQVADVDKIKPQEPGEEGSADEEDQEDLDTTEKSASLVRFQELTGQYFGCSPDTTMTGEKTENLPCFVNKISEKEILIDAMAVVSDLMQSTNTKDGEDTLQLSDPEVLDYTALAVTKFFHGMATVRAPIATSRHHRLFGKWQAIRFGTLLATVQKVLSHAH